MPNRLPNSVYRTRKSATRPHRAAVVSAEGLFLAEDDSPAGEIVGREFDFDFVAREDADEVFSHFARDMPEDFARGPPLLDAKLEHRVGQRGSDGGVDFDGF